jgi:pimeloyl-ACP methyl ester carboxylesterase
MAEKANSIVLIHGLWMTPVSWEHWVRRYEDAGYEVHTPAWPGMDRDVEVLRKDPSAIAGLELRAVADHHERFIRDLPSQPIIIGHSFGGLLTQMMLDRGLGVAGVAIHSAQIKGVWPLPFTVLKAAAPVLANPLNYGKAKMFDPAQFHYAFTNTLDEKSSLEAWQRYCVPAPARVLFQGALANFHPNAASRVDTKNDHRPPLLMIAGDADHIVPPKIVRLNTKLYAKSRAITEYEEFQGRDHFTCGAPGWETVADRALEWATGHLA